MDTTAKYILMCEKAVEIQKEWHRHTGDMYFKMGKIVILGSGGWEDDGSFTHTHIVLTEGPVIHTLETIHLPRQDQLQEMSGLSWWEFDERCNDIRRCLLEDPLSGIEVETKERAGICVLMEKYNKVWSGKEWVKK